VYVISGYLSVATYKMYSLYTCQFHACRRT